MNKYTNRPSSAGPSTYRPENLKPAPETFWSSSKKKFRPSSAKATATDRNPSASNAVALHHNSSSASSAHPSSPLFHNNRGAAENNSTNNSTFMNASSISQQSGNSFQTRLRPTSALKSRALHDTKMRAVSLALQERPGGPVLPQRDTVKGYVLPRQRPSEIEQELIEELHMICGDTKGYNATTTKYRYLSAHRSAFKKYLATQDEPTASLLQRIFEVYEATEVHKFESDYAVLSQKLVTAETRVKQAEATTMEMKLQLETAKLQMDNLRRQLNAKNEVISQISSTHKINVAAVNWMTGVDSKVGANRRTDTAQQEAPQQSTQRTMAEIRTVQKRVTAAYGEAQRKSEREDDDGMMELRKEIENDEDKREMELVEQRYSRQEEIGGTPAVELRKAASEEGSMGEHQHRFSISQPTSSSQLNNAKMLKSGSSQQLHDNSSNANNKSQSSFVPETTAEAYRHCQRTDNVGVDLEIDAEPDEEEEMQANGEESGEQQ